MRKLIATFIILLSLSFISPSTGNAQTYYGYQTRTTQQCGYVYDPYYRRYRYECRTYPVYRNRGNHYGWRNRDRHNKSKFRFNIRIR